MAWWWYGVVLDLIDPQTVESGIQTIIGPNVFGSFVEISAIRPFPLWGYTYAHNETHSVMTMVTHLGCHHYYLVWCVLTRACNSVSKYARSCGLERDETRVEDERAPVVVVMSEACRRGIKAKDKEGGR